MILTDLTAIIIVPLHQYSTRQPQPTKSNLPPDV